MLQVKLAPNPELPDSRGRKKGWSFEWAWALLFMLLAPAILVTLHTLCQTGELTMILFEKFIFNLVLKLSI